MCQKGFQFSQSREIAVNLFVEKIMHHVKRTIFAALMSVTVASCSSATAPIRSEMTKEAQATQDPRYDMAIVQLKASHFAKSLPIFEALHREHRASIPVLNGLGQSLVGLGRYDAARVMFECSVDLNPKDKVAIEALAQLDAR